MMPTVSVLLPVFNCVNTLPFALASLQAQTHEDWECILVDDGSPDCPNSVVELFHDCRFLCHRLERNRGRGFARQYALDLAKGKYIAFLDGDDWIYPDKLRLQIEVLVSNPELSAVSAGMCISEVSGRLVGVRKANVIAPTTFGMMRHPGMPPLAFAPTLMRAELAKITGFDTSFAIAEDVDFLLRALLGRPYAVLSGPLYVYREQGTTSLAKVNAALDNCCRMFKKQFREYPLDSAIEVVKARGKQAIYRAAAASGHWDHIIARRSRIPSELEHQQYRIAWETVSAIADRHFMCLGERSSAGLSIS